MLSGLSRGAGTSRIEAFSDGVFAFALTLLVVSLEVPRTYADLLDTMRGFPAFGACFAILVWIWVLILPMNLIGVAGFVYASLGPIHAFHGWRSNRSVPQSHP